MVISKGRIARRALIRTWWAEAGAEDDASSLTRRQIRLAWHDWLQWSGRDASVECRTMNVINAIAALVDEGELPGWWTTRRWHGVRFLPVPVQIPSASAILPGGPGGSIQMPLWLMKDHELRAVTDGCDQCRRVNEEIARRARTGHDRLTGELEVARGRLAALTAPDAPAQEQPENARQAQPQPRDEPAPALSARDAYRAWRDAPRD
jgi:hypothetical protein